MPTPLTVIALCACVLCLGACDKTSSTPPTPTLNSPVPTDSGATPGSVGTPSVPSAASVFSPASAAQAEQTSGRSNNTMSTGQESTAMPMPGQNNDHSAPLGSDRRASAP